MALLNDVEQCTGHVLMVRPVHFHLNKETAVDNAFQDANGKHEKVGENALKEFDGLVHKLREAGVEVTVVPTHEADTPDSVFPNNWISFHSCGSSILYPMKCENRRKEKRRDVIETIQQRYKLEAVQHDFSFLEMENKFLEGTGSLVLDRVNKVAYAAVSERTHPDALVVFKQRTGYEIVSFTAYSSHETEKQRRIPIYHTNVMMSVGDRFAVICLDSIDCENERNSVKDALLKSKKDVIEISEAQIGAFAGNMLQLQVIRDNVLKKYMVMSTSAYNSLSQEQHNKLLEYNDKLVYSPLDTIEKVGGGSVRCTIAEIFLPTR